MRSENPSVALKLSLEEAEAAHAELEDRLESESLQSESLQKLYRLLGWRILAVKAEAGQTSGLTKRLADIAREAGSLEEFETTRDETLGPILDGLERGENRDP